MEARDPRSRAREINIKSGPGIEEPWGILSEQNSGKLRAAKNCIGFEHSVVIDLAMLEAIAEGRADDGLDNVSGDMAAI